MEATITAPRRMGRRPLAALGKVAAGALVGLAALFGYVQLVVFGAFIPVVTGFAAVAVLLAGLVTMGWRWSPLVATLACGALLALMLGPASGEIFYILSRPHDVGLFALIVLLLPVLAIGAVAGIAATVQNYRYAAADRRTPLGLRSGLLLLLGLVAGAIAVAAAPQSSDAGGVSPEALASLPAVTPEHFMPGKEIKVKAGELVALRLENSDGVGHTFDIDELGVHAPMPNGKPGLALFRPTKPGTYTFYCVPHYNKATGEGMQGKLIVE